MGKTLVIVESPTKAKTISKFLGAQYMVESSFGHVRDLPKSKMGIDIEGGTFEPTYTISKEKTKQVKKLKDLAKKADEIIFATDEDREGEAISWHLAHILKIDPDKAKRIVFHEITKHAIDEALKSPRSIDQKLVDAQQARRVLDRLVGYELSPLLWKKVARGLSAGRVQSVAVRLIVERERERTAFQSQEYWSITGTFKTPKDETFEASLHAKDGKKLDKMAIGSEADAKAVIDALASSTYTITSLETKQAKRNPPPPYRTSTLQQQANQKLGYSSKQTMRVAQQLYEGINLGGHTVGLITYMRTDSTNLSQKFLNETSQFVANEYGSRYTLDKPRVYKGKAKGAQEAHEAIRPTDPTRTPDSIKDRLDNAQYKLYSLIWKRAVATQMKEALLDRISADITSSSKPEYLFRATGQSVAFDGWLALYPNAVKTEMLPHMKEKEILTCEKVHPEQHFTQPPARYSDATLIKTLEEHGIGRPSTYAPTISTIEARNYVTRDEDKRLAPNDIASVVTDLLTEHFETVSDYSFTAQMEDNLDAIAEGEKDWKPIISTFYHPFHKKIVEKTENLTREEVSHTRELGSDPKTGKPVSGRIGRYGPFVQLGSKEDEEKPRFASIPKGTSLENITLEEALVLLQLPRILGQHDGNDVQADIGRFGPYVKVEKNYYSLKGTEYDPYSITLEQAIEVIKLKEEEKAKKTIKVFEEEGIKILNGPYGAYVTDGKKNGRIPKDNEKPEELTLKECIDILKTAKPKRKGGRKKVAAKKK